MKVEIRDLDAGTYEGTNKTAQIIDLDKNIIRLFDSNGLYCSIKKEGILEEHIAIRIFSIANKTRVETAFV